MEYKFGSDTSISKRSGEFGYPPLMEPNVQHEFYDNSIEYCLLSEKLIKIFIIKVPNFEWPTLRTFTFQYLNYYASLRVIRYALTYIDKYMIEDLKPILNVVNSISFEEMENAMKLIENEMKMID